MPLDASDRIRTIQQLALFNGYVTRQTTLNPRLNVSTCAGYYGSTTVHTYNSYETKTYLEQGLQYYSSCITRS
jgi:hypothetical protein